jgi:putative transposase
MLKKTDTQFYYRRMPHYQPDNGVLFITFRLNNSLPQDFVTKLNEYKLMIKSTITTGSYYQNLIRKKIFDFYDQLLAGYQTDVDYLSKPEIAEIVVNTLKKFDGDLYDLFSFTVMPNHVHLLLRIRQRNEGEFHKLAFIVKKLKSITAHDANIILGRSGTFWQREYFDYCARNGKEVMNIVNYIVMNPVKAKLVSEPGQWSWSYISDNL